MQRGMFCLMVIGAVLMIAGCEKGDPVSSVAGYGPDVSPRQASDPPQNKAPVAEKRPGDSDGKYRRVHLHASFTTTSVVLAPPPFLRLEITGTGRGTHIGRATFVATPTINFTVPPPFPLSGTSVLTAANGDRLFTSFTGSSTPPDANDNISITNTQTVTGGTGRFAGATGTLAGAAVAHNANPVGTATLEGTIFLTRGGEDEGDVDLDLRVE